jgi:hypothetical protein
MGHSRGFGLNVYIAGPGLVRLREMIERVKYEGLVISRLHV